MAVKAAVKQQYEAVGIGGLEDFSGGFGMSEGDYIIKEANIVEHAGFGQNPTMEPRLGLMIDYVLRSDPSGEAQQQFYGLGRKAIESYAPNPTTGKGLIKRAGADTVSPLNNKTNYFIFLKSLYDSGMPQGILTDDVSVIEGTHVHIQLVAEPEERKGFRGNTGEVDNPGRKNMIAVVSEIKEDGKPWEGTGGLKAAGKKAAPAKLAAVAPKAAPAEVEEAEEAAEVDSDDVRTAAINGISAVLEKNPRGLPKLKMRTEVFTAVKKSAGNETAQAVTDNFLADDEELGGLLGELGYALKGGMVVVAA